MAIVFKIVLLSVLISNLVIAEPIKLTKVKSLPVAEGMLPGFEFDTDQAFKISSGTLKGKFIFFARKHVEAPDSTIPRFVVSDNKKIISSVELPHIIESWNLVQPQAVSIGDPDKSDGSVRILAVLTMEPASGRSSDYWEQPFVFDISPDGSIESNVRINSAMAEISPRPKTIKEIKKFLSKTKIK